MGLAPLWRDFNGPNSLRRLGLELGFTNKVFAICQILHHRAVTGAHSQKLKHTKITYYIKQSTVAVVQLMVCIVCPVFSLQFFASTSQTKPASLNVSTKERYRTSFLSRNIAHPRMQSLCLFIAAKHYLIK